MRRLNRFLLFSIIVLFLTISFYSCDLFRNSSDDPAVNEVIFIGTRVPPDFRATGIFDLVVTPLDEQGEAILANDIDISILIDNPVGLMASTPNRSIDEPTGNPIAVALNIDASGSMRGTDPTDARLAGARILVQVLNAGETSFEAAVFRYPPIGDLLQGFTANTDSLDAAINQIGSAGSTPTYNSLMSVLDYTEQEKPAGNFDRSIVLLSDGQPQDTNLRPDVCMRANQLEIPIYAIGLGPASDIDGNQTRAVEEMRAIAECTAAAYVGIAPTNLDSSAAVIFNNIAVATSEGAIIFQAQVEGEGFAQLQVGDILRGFIELSAGGGSASTFFSFRIP